MKYDVLVRINNSPTRVIGWGYIVNAFDKSDAVTKALSLAQAKVDKKYSRYKKCTLFVNDDEIKPIN